ncbi:hypothetical protein BDZ90DRAFT_226629 [Jaminaea rosea]|uniref:Uncharacterized protein n=1 Tax=Jaminaea rosea TaxID=1569628 RepID=A0A316UU80_9BASI|nr:hypothetical protein BDZ90DRAFT_226629 [Jaminaea rosea]PWN28554.1 hypothetical protein BDZ90DRAFT_226629 [Jaminaea rosea]
MEEAVRREVRRQTNEHYSLQELSPTFQVAGTLFSTPLQCERDAEWAELLAALNEKPNKPLNVFCDIPIDPPPLPEAPPVLAPSDSVSQAAGPSLEVVPATQESVAPTPTPQRAPRRSRTAQQLEERDEWLVAVKAKQAEIEQEIPRCEEHSKHRNSDVRCYLNFHGTHHPLDLHLMFQWAIAAYDGHASDTQPPDDLLVKSLDRVSEARGIHAANRSACSQGQSSHSSSSSGPQTPNQPGQRPTMVTPSPGSRTALGQMSSNAVAAAPAAPERVPGPKISVWAFVKRLDQGGERLAARLTKGGITTMSMLAKAKARGALGAFSLGVLEDIIVEGWVEEWYDSDEPGEMTFAQAASIREAKQYGDGDAVDASVDASTSLDEPIEGRLLSSFSSQHF